MFNRHKIKELEQYCVELRQEIIDREKELFQLMEKFKFQEGTLLSQRELINTLKTQLTSEFNRTNNLQQHLLQMNTMHLEKTKEALGDLFEEEPDVTESEVVASE
jgi:predicted RNase H-like nuclease (RuvC/YqgF family)